MFASGTNSAARAPVSRRQRDRVEAFSRRGGRLSLAHCVSSLVPRAGAAGSNRGRGAGAWRGAVACAPWTPNAPASCSPRNAPGSRTRWPRSSATARSRATTASSRATCDSEDLYQDEFNATPRRGSAARTGGARARRSAAGRRDVRPVGRERRADPGRTARGSPDGRAHHRGTGSPRSRVTHPRGSTM